VSRFLKSSKETGEVQPVDVFIIKNKIGTIQIKPFGGGGSCRIIFKEYAAALLEEMGFLYKICQNVCEQQLNV